jgi:putative hydrolase of the HAD superfamily
MIRAVIFDMDDVLCRYDWRGRIDALARLASRPAAEVKAAIWDSGFEDEADRGALDADAYLAGFAARLGRPFSRADWIADRKASMTPWPDMLALAGEIAARADVAVLTNNGRLTHEAIDALFPALRPIFGERIIVSGALGLAKPDPRAYRAVLQRLGVAPREALFTDDLAENVAGAEAAGLHGHVHAGADALRARIAALGGLAR